MAGVQCAACTAGPDITLYSSDGKRTPGTSPIEGRRSRAGRCSRPAIKAPPSPDHLYYTDVAKRIDANRAALSAACKFESPLPGDRHGRFGERLGVLVRREVDGILAMPAAPDRSVRHGSRMALGLALPARQRTSCSFDTPRHPPGAPRRRVDTPQDTPGVWRLVARLPSTGNKVSRR